MERPEVPARVALFFGWAASPVWYRTSDGSGDVDLDALPITPGLRDRLKAWNASAGQTLSANDFAWPDERSEAEFTAAGSDLAQDLRDELGIEVVHTPDGDTDEPTPPPDPLGGSRDAYGWYAYAPLNDAALRPRSRQERAQDE